MATRVNPRKAVDRRRRLVLEGLEGRSMLSGGMVDPNFGVNGLATFQAGKSGAEDGASVVVAGPDGSTFLGGSVQNPGEPAEPYLIKLDADGMPDTSFGDGGSVDLSFYQDSTAGADGIPRPYAIPAAPDGTHPDPDATGSGSIESVAVQADGKIVVAERVGFTITSPGTRFTYDDVLIRLNADGTPDKTFVAPGTAGASTSAGLTLPYAVSIDALDPLQGTNLAIQPDGEILAQGSASQQDNTFTDVGGTFTATGDYNPRFAITRINPDGSTDVTFGVDGVATSPDGDAAGSVALQPDGKIVLAGSVSTILVNGPQAYPGGDGPQDTIAAAFRLDSTGAFDTSFGTGGEVELPPPVGFFGALNALALAPDGGIIVSGVTIAKGLPTYPAPDAPMPYYLAKLDADGSLDASFGTGGLEDAPAGDIPADLAVRPDGTIVVGSTVESTTIGESETFDVVGLTPSGTFDTTFGQSGHASVPIAPVYSGSISYATRADVLALRADGTVIVAGAVVTSPATGTTSSPGVEFAATQITLGQLIDIVPAPIHDDPTIYLPSIGAFARRNGSGLADTITPFGIPGAGQTIPALGEYDGNGSLEIAAYLPRYGAFAIRPDSGAADEFVPFGFAGAGQTIPTPGDYDADGKTDIAAYLPSLGEFAIRPSSGGADELIPFGLAGVGASIPAPGDYFGDGKTDLAVYLPSLAEFAVRPSSGGPDVYFKLGLAGAGASIPAPGDYFGDGKTDLAVYLPSLAEFAIAELSGSHAEEVVPFGAEASIPIPGNYDGSGKADLAVYLPDAGAFAYRPADGGPDVVEPFGIAGDGESIPVAESVPTAYGFVTIDDLPVAATSAKAKARPVTGSNLLG